MTMPLFPTESQLAEYVFGKGKLSEWRTFAILQERHGLPKMDPITGRRFFPAVVAFLYRRYGLTDKLPMNPDGAEKWDKPFPRQDSDGGTAKPTNVVPIGSQGRT